jgi:hypothetical protein
VATLQRIFILNVHMQAITTCAAGVSGSSTLVNGRLPIVVRPATKAAVQKVQLDHLSITGSES